MCIGHATTHLRPIVHFYSPQKGQKTSGFSDVFRGYRKGALAWNKVTLFLVLSYVSCWSVTKKNVRCDFLNFWRTPMFDGKFLSWLCCFKIAWLLGIFGLLWRKVLVFYYSFFFSENVNLVLFLWTKISKILFLSISTG